MELSELRSLLSHYRSRWVLLLIGLFFLFAFSYYAANAETGVETALALGFAVFFLASTVGLLSNTSWGWWLNVITYSFGILIALIQVQLADILIPLLALVGLFKTKMFYGANRIDLQELKQAYRQAKEARRARRANR